MFHYLITRKFINKVTAKQNACPWYVSSINFQRDYFRFARNLLFWKFGMIGRTNFLLENLCQGNWEHLWETEAEKSKSVYDWFDMLRWETFYCSDRWSWDRFLRVHWIFQRIMDRIRYENTEEKVG